MSEHELVRFQAYAAIAQIGTDETVQDLVEAFHHDPSSMVRIDAGGCGLAHCGMLTRAQRMLAIPGLIEMVEDRALAPVDVSYGYRALREITDQTLADNPRLWREWFARTAPKRRTGFAGSNDAEPQHLCGRSPLRCSALEGMRGTGVVRAGSGNLVIG